MPGSFMNVARSAIVRTPGVATSRIASRAARRAGRRRRERRGQLEVRRVVVAVGEHDRVLAGVGEHVEFLRGAAADRAGIGVHGAEPQAEAREDRV